MLLLLLLLLLLACIEICCKLLFITRKNDTWKRRYSSFLSFAVGTYYTVVVVSHQRMEYHDIIEYALAACIG